MSPRRIKIDVTELKRLYTRKRMGIAAIAAQTGYAAGTIRRRLLEAKVKLREPGRPMDPEPSAEALRQRRCRQRKAEQG